jgi:hypothetical protein
MHNTLRPWWVLFKARGALTVLLAVCGLTLDHQLAQVYSTAYVHLSVALGTRFGSTPAIGKPSSVSLRAQPAPRPSARAPFAEPRLSAVVSQRCLSPLWSHAGPSRRRRLSPVSLSRHPTSCPRPPPVVLTPRPPLAPSRGMRKSIQKEPSKGSPWARLNTPESLNTILSRRSRAPQRRTTSLL